MQLLWHLQQLSAEVLGMLLLQPNFWVDIRQWAAETNCLVAGVTAI
jgi:hypothetical protein